MTTLLNFELGTSNWKKNYSLNNFSVKNSGSVIWKTETCNATGTLLK